MAAGCHGMANIQIDEFHIKVRWLFGLATGKERSPLPRDFPKFSLLKDVVQALGAPSDVPLRHPAVTIIMAIIEATGWQAHSVRGDSRPLWRHSTPAMHSFCRCSSANPRSSDSECRGGSSPPP
jgi:hypothetical protein